jgi:pimeloyl-ACP methyl ester carboxylesterase
LENVNTIGPTYATPPPHIDCAKLASLKIPTLVLNGAGTRLFYQLSGQTAAACIPGAKSASIPEARHMVIVERPGATAVSMLEFLAEQTDASQAGHSG